MKKICHCELSGELHVIDSTTCCEVCDLKETLEITPENVQKAFQFYQTRLELTRQ